MWMNEHLISELPIKSFGSIHFTYLSNKGNLSHILPVSQNENQSGDSPAIIRCLHIRYTEITWQTILPSKHISQKEKKKIESHSKVFPQPIPKSNLYQHEQGMQTCFLLHGVSHAFPQWRTILKASDLLQKLWWQLIPKPLEWPRWLGLGSKDGRQGWITMCLSPSPSTC